MSDLISRQAAIDFIDAGRICNPNEPRWSDNEIVNFLKSRPSAQPTLYGYSIEHLALIARVMQKENVTPEKAIECFNDIGRIVQMIVDEQHEMIKRAMEKWMI